MTYVQRFQVPEDLFELVLRDSGINGGLNYNNTVSIRDTTVEKFSEYRRLWRALHNAWKSFEPELTLAELSRGSIAYSAQIENGDIIFSKGSGNYLFTSENFHRIPFSSVKNEIAAMLPKGVSIAPDNGYLVYSGVGIAQRVLVHLSKVGPIFRLIGSGEDIAAWELSTLLSRINHLNASWKDGLRAMIRQNREVKPEHLNRHDRAMLAVKKDTGKSLEEFINKRRTELHTGEIVIDTLPIAPHGTLSSRRWGIEIELAGARGVEAPEFWEKKDDGSLRSAYVSHEYIDPEDCECDHRGEVQATLEDGTTMYVDNPNYTDADYCDYCGEQNEDDEDGNWEDTAEIVSPILKSFHSRGLEKLLEDAKDEPQNYSAGTHVHVEAKDLTAKQLGALVYAYEFIEPLIEASYGRTEREYCKRYGVEELQELNRRIKNQEGDRGYGEGDRLAMGRRYKTVNLMALDTHGTVEFRAMGAAGDGDERGYEFLIRWAHFCREMVNVAKANVPMSVWSAVKTFDDVKRIFAVYGKETSELTLAELDFNPDTIYELVDKHITYTTTLDGVRELVEV